MYIVSIGQQHNNIRVSNNVAQGKVNKYCLISRFKHAWVELFGATGVPIWSHPIFYWVGSNLQAIWSHPTIGKTSFNVIMNVITKLVSGLDEALHEAH